MDLFATHLERVELHNGKSVMCPTTEPPMYECDCCGRRNVPAKLKGIGYYCEDCLVDVLWSVEEEAAMRAGRDPGPAPVSHYPVCPLKLAS